MIKQPKWIRLSLVLSIFSWFHCTLDEDIAQREQTVTVTLQPDGAGGKDGRAYSLQPDTPSPNVPLLYAMAWTFNGVPGTVRGFLDFDIPSPPAGATLISATLSLFAETTTPPYGHSTLSGSNELIVRQITSPWNEATVSWNDQPSSDHLTQLVLPASTSSSQTYNIDVTDFVKRELNAPSQFHGFMFQLQNESYYRAVIFGSSDNANPALRPKLVLEYSNSTGGTGKIYGHVYRYGGSGLAGARVDAGNGHVAITDTYGNFIMPNLPLGTYTLRTSLPGWTFGSPEYQDQQYTVTLSFPGASAYKYIPGYDRDPVVMVHGWTDNAAEFTIPKAALEQSGRYVVAHDLETSLLWTPPLEVNAKHVQSWIKEAKEVTGRQQVVLYGHSMGGLVARAYLEGSDYDGDVSQFFTAGTPHWGIPAILNSGCLPNQPAVCEMTAVGMKLFNLFHWKRRGVDYHEIGGDAPMWRWVELFCVSLPWHKYCLSIPLPSFEYRNVGFWAMGLLIPGKDDGFIRTYSTVGQLSTNIDRFVTHEVHDGPHRDYHDWESSNSSCTTASVAHESCEAFARCVRRVLIDRTTTTCGTRAYVGPPPYSFFAPSATSSLEPGPAPDGITANPRLTHTTRRGEGILYPGQRIERTVFIEGGATTFSASLQVGSGSFSLIDPSGLVMDAAYAASIVAPDTSTQGSSNTVPPEAVIYSADAGASIFHVPAARPGAWRMVLVGNPDIPITGTQYSTAAGFDSTLAVALQLEHPFQAIGQPIEIALRLSEPITTGTAEVSILRDGVNVGTIQLTRREPTLYAATWTVTGPEGYITLDWSLVGQRANGLAFERAGREWLMVQSSELTLGTGHSDHAIPRPNLPGLNQALAVDLHVISKYAGDKLGVAAELQAPDGTVVSRTLASAPAVLATNTIELRFRGEEIYQSRVDGPYRVANVRLLDQRGATLLAQEIAVAHTTAAYGFRSFAPSLDAPSVSLDGPFRVAAGATITLEAIGIDPNGDPLTYGWDFDEDGIDDAQGAKVPFTAPASGPAGLRTIRVRVTDPGGHTAEASASLEIFIPVITNLALNAEVSAKSSQPGHPVSRINDGDRGTSDGSSASWVNGIADRCTGPAPTSPDCGRGPDPRDLPTWVELDFNTFRTIQSVGLYLSKSQPVRDYEIQVDDGSGWRSIALVTGNTADSRVHDLPDIAATRLRLWLTRGAQNGPDFVRINEIEVLGY
ncbi:MAG TPA: alpha/beta fold hydrolase [Kofleriaceae bacterium]|nr:alpha/beta fold hydrolase [Kofleriaceae bacterium]